MTDQSEKGEPLANQPEELLLQEESAGELQPILRLQTIKLSTAVVRVFIQVI